VVLLWAPQDPVTAARVAEAAGNFALAEQHYQAALATKPDAELYQRLGLVRHLQNKFADAIPAFEKAIAANPRLWGSQLFLGIAYYRTNRFHKAVDHLKAADSLQPKHNEIEFWLGATHLALKNYLEGLATLERVLERDPANTEVLRILAERYTEYVTALWNGVAERHFDTAPGQEVHGHALNFDGAERAAMEAYRRALALEPARRGVHLAIGRTLLSRGRSKEAVSELEQELHLQPGDPEASYYLGMALLTEKRYADALSHLQVADRWTTHSADAPIALARAYAALGLVQQANAAIERALRIAPRSEEAQQVRGSIRP
jgi:tetratricopeptide (TPR) repeat protein